MELLPALVLASDDDDPIDMVLVAWVLWTCETSLVTTILPEAEILKADVTLCVVLVVTVTVDVTLPGSGRGSTILGIKAKPVDVGTN